MKIVFTSHAREKLLEQEAKNLKITRKKIVAVLKKPVITDKKLNPHRSIGKLAENLSLCVIWKLEKGEVKVITFYPAQKGRYENKVL